MKPIALTPEEQDDPYLAMAIVAHDRAWSEVIDLQKEARDKWQAMNKEQVDRLLSNQQGTLERFKKCRAKLVDKRPTALARRLKVAERAESDVNGGSSCATDRAGTGSGAPTRPTNAGRPKGEKRSRDAPES